MEEEHINCIKVRIVVFTLKSLNANDTFFLLFCLYSKYIDNYKLINEIRFYTLGRLCK